KLALVRPNLWRWCELGPTLGGLRDLAPEHLQIALLAGTNEPADVQVCPGEVGGGIKKLFELPAQKQMARRVGEEFVARLVVERDLERLQTGDADVRSPFDQPLESTPSAFQLHDCVGSRFLLAPASIDHQAPAISAIPRASAK